MKLPLGLLVAVLTLNIPRAAAAPASMKVGCTPVEAFPITQELFEREFKPKLSGAGIAVPQQPRYPGVHWDLGDDKSARLALYYTKTCKMGLRTSVRHSQSSPDLDGALRDFAKTLREEAPDWTFSVTPPNTIAVERGGVRHATDLPALVQARLDAATPVVLGATPVRILFDGGSIAVTPADLEKGLHLERANWSAPSWAYYDLTPFGLPKLVMQFDKPGVTVWALP